MGLQGYQTKRNFKATPEPRGKVSRSRGSSFVVQKHAASHLHYDFRLELDGVLKSWAVTKGPSLVPREKRLAVEVEDHPLEYGTFEGTIPEGEYGGGAVMVWDRGRWTPEGDPHDGLAKGHLDFELDGEKLRGRWHLVRLRGNKRGKKRSDWLLIKAKDRAARERDDADILEQEPRSVMSGRLIEQIGDAGAVSKRSLRQRKDGARGRPATSSARSRARSRDDASRKRDDAVTLTHPDRVYWPDVGLTKQALAEYYTKVWKWIAPHVIERPLALLRCPDGIEQACFFQKQPWQGLRKSIAIHANPGIGGNKLLTIGEVDGLVALVQAGVLEIHVWGATIGDLDRPDRLIFDLDPGPDRTWSDLVVAATAIRERLEGEGLESFAKTTGGKGLHVVAPLRPKAEWDEVKAYARRLAQSLAKEAPELYTATAAKQARKGRIFIDYLRNGHGATSVAPYSTRARPGAPVSVPVGWDEIGSIRGDSFHVADTPRRLSRLKVDPWARFLTLRQALPGGRSGRTKG
jgi:bifunctional non-homologous end joining protein LigD